MPLFEQLPSALAGSFFILRMVDLVGESAAFLAVAVSVYLHEPEITIVFGLQRECLTVLDHSQHVFHIPPFPHQFMSEQTPGNENRVLCCANLVFTIGLRPCRIQEEVACSMS